MIVHCRGSSAPSKQPAYQYPNEHCADDTLCGMRGEALLYSAEKTLSSFANWPNWLLLLVRRVSNRPGGVCRRSAHRGGGCRALLLGGRQFLRQRLQFLRDRTIRSHCNTKKLTVSARKRRRDRVIFGKGHALDPTRFRVSGTLKSYEFLLTMFEVAQRCDAPRRHLSHLARGHSEFTMASGSEGERTVCNPSDLCSNSLEGVPTAQNCL
jgi:hypothetical protein